MRKLLFITLAFIGAANVIGQTKTTLSFKAEIANRNTDAITFLDRNNGKEIKKIEIGKDGVFKDSFGVEEGFYMLFDGKEYTQLFLKNGYDLKLKMDAKKFDESIVYTGNGAVENNILAQNALEDAKYDYDALLASSEEGFSKLIAEKTAAELVRLENKKLDATFIALQKKNIEKSVTGLTKYYEEGLKTRKLNGSLSPSFEYDNYNGGKTKLEEFRGKYVYIDVWATWCAPCRVEIPFLKKLEEKYHDKNIVFVSLSIDQKKDVEKWKKLIKDKELGGVQVFADNDWNSQFVKDYNITGIPRFIIIDPNGNIVKADAPRPSSPTIEAEFDALLK
ncbi:TlpA family protein disulfide reductase [Flavobacterium hiemivividum]|uniref:TlpA family protein disulfide reductase n=1 Tax=Flavobacterium hiemivividum TaxID=2541734 RepID=A0A4R5D3S5_9FLAO|nr:TlpA disulfide reductase family protein [Flavobacterium hiemivividum]TDE06141.1 TlpA family protein disulfide reductase [Flavobacterium hiemivividum]